MKDDFSGTEINVARIPVDGNVGGLIFAASTVIIFLCGIPLIQYLFPVALASGCAIALILHFVRHETPVTPWILPARKE